MMSPEIWFFLHQQRHREMLRQAEQARLLRAMRRTPESGERAFQRLTWWLGRSLLSWGCTLQAAGRVTSLAKKGCCVCPL